MGPGRGGNGACVLQLIICSECRTRPGFKRRLCVRLSVRRVGRVDSGVCSEGTFCRLIRPGRGGERAGICDAVCLDLINGRPCALASSGLREPALVTNGIQLQCTVRFPSPLITTPHQAPASHTTAECRQVGTSSGNHSAALGLSREQDAAASMTRCCSSGGSWSTSRVLS